MKNGILFIGAICIAIASFAVFSSFEDANQAKIDAKYDELKKAFLEGKMNDCLSSADAVAQAKYDEEVASMAGPVEEPANPGKATTTKPRTTTPPKTTTATTGGSEQPTTTTTTTAPVDPKTGKMGGNTTVTTDKKDKISGDKTTTTTDKKDKMKGGN